MALNVVPKRAGYTARSGETVRGCGSRLWAGVCGGGVVHGRAESCLKTQITSGKEGGV